MTGRQWIPKFSAHLIPNGEQTELLERRQKPSRSVVCTLSGLLRIHRRRGQGWEALFAVRFDLQICQVPFVAGPSSKRDPFQPSATPTNANTPVGVQKHSRLSSSARETLRFFFSSFSFVTLSPWNPFSVLWNCNLPAKLDFHRNRGSPPNQNEVAKF